MIDTARTLGSVLGSRLSKAFSPVGGRRGVAAQPATGPVSLLTAQ